MIIITTKRQLRKKDFVKSSYHLYYEHLYQDYSVEMNL